MKASLNRRDFLATSAAASAALAITPALGSGSVAAPRAPLPSSATDIRTLGQTGIQVGLIGMGTGSVGVEQSSNQIRLGVKEFTRVVRHALDRGVTLFDVADQYGSHVFLREALKGVPRDRYQVQTKTHARNERIARSHIERYRLELGIDYIDILLLHCMTEGDWPEKHSGAMEHLMQAREQGLIRAHGTSCHGMDPLRTAAKHPFVQVDLARINPQGLIMDDKSPDEVASELQEMHDGGKGVIGMKILGEGRITTPEGKDETLRFVLGLGTVDAFIIGFESIDQVDDILKRTDDAIAFHKARG
jgi:aryl-alcohol dehydrogenase-like predicted oxidoreductase